MGILMSSYSQKSTLTPHNADSKERGEQSRHGSCGRLYISHQGECRAERAVDDHCVLQGCQYSETSDQQWNRNLCKLGAGRRWTKCMQCGGRMGSRDGWNEYTATWKQEMFMQEVNWLHGPLNPNMLQNDLETFSCSISIEIFTRTHRRFWPKIWWASWPARVKRAGTRRYAGNHLSLTHLIPHGVVMFHLTWASWSFAVFLDHLLCGIETLDDCIWPGASCLTSMFDGTPAMVCCCRCCWHISLIAAWVLSLDVQLDLLHFFLTELTCMV